MTSLTNGRQVAVFAAVLGIDWESITVGKLAAFFGGVAGFLLAAFACEPGFIFLLDHANLLFHEAGHPIIGLCSSRLEPYGGTIGQLVFPSVIAIQCFRRGHVLGVAASTIWFFENWLNIARYMADARAMELPLVGGGDHDWQTILSRWGLLEYDTRIAGWIKMLAWTGIGLACVGVVLRAVVSFRSNNCPEVHDKQREFAS